MNWSTHVRRHGLAMTDAQLEAKRKAHREWLDAAREDYPDDCVVCGEELDDPHPDDPPVHAGHCEDSFFAREDADRL